MVKNGTFPFWNPYSLNGYPLFATIQPGVLYPLSIIYLLLPFDLAFNYTIVLHFFLTGLFTYLLMRCLKAGYCASLISAITLMLGGYLLSIHCFLNNLLSVAWAPLVFLLFLLGLQKESFKFIIFSALAACTMFLGGGVEIVYVTLIMVCLLTLFWNVGATRRVAPTGGHVPLPWKQRLCYLGVFIAIFLGLSAVQLLPFMELSTHSIRADAFSYEAATMWSMHPRDLVQFFLLDLYGYKLRPEKYWIEQNYIKTIYLGTIPFLLSLFFFVKRDKRVLYAFLVIIAGSLILAFGWHTPIYFYLYKYVPYFNKMRYPVKFLFLTTIAISVTAGLGYDRLIYGIREKSLLVRRLVYGISAFGLLAAIMFGILNFFETPISNLLHLKGFDAPNYNILADNIENIKRLLYITSIFGLVVFIGLKFTATRKFLPLAVLVPLTFDLFFAHQGFYLKTLSKTYHGTSSNIDFILSDKSLFRIFVTPETEDERILVASQTKGKGKDRTNLNLQKINPGLGIERHIFDICGKDVTKLKRVADLDKLILTAPALYSSNLLDLMNVKYIISSQQIISDKLKMVNMNISDILELSDKMHAGKIRMNPDLFSNKKINEAIEKFYIARVRIYQNIDCLPRAFLVKDYKVVSSGEECEKILSSMEFNPSKLVLLEENPILQHNQNHEQKKIVEKVEITRYNANSIALQANAAEPKFLFTSESYYPGWKAYVDGKPAHIYRANYAFRALLLEPGEHKVEFIYDPWTFKIGLIISIISVIGVTFLLIRFRLCKLKK
ncbi:MAG TPA: YfhO family protein [Candidatus Brocadiia bacterium]|nr:YfhO family protein [Candidatus Brocadiales bacterium]